MPFKVKDLKLRVPIIGGSLGRGLIEAVASPVYSMSMIKTMRIRIKIKTISQEISGFTVSETAAKVQDGGSHIMAGKFL